MVGWQVCRDETSTDSEDAGMRNFCVAMPHLTHAVLQLQDFPEPLWNTLHFLAVLDISAVPLCADQPPLLKGEGDGRMTLVLDLDETLVHCRAERLPTPRHSFCVHFEETDTRGWMYVRPFARLFLEIVSRLFEVVVFTASSQSYADQVLDTLDPDGRRFSARLYRQHCTEWCGGFLKDMRRLGREIDRVVLVDNSPMSLVLCPDNGILCSSWTADEAIDRELLDLLLVLQQLMLRGSVSSILPERYGLRDFFHNLRSRPEVLGLH